MLKLCNVIRNRLNVHGGSFDYVKRRSGLGGTGGRKLSPDLRFKFGTYGFNNRNDAMERARKSLTSSTVPTTRASHRQDGVLVSSGEGECKAPVSKMDFDATPD